jgi:hypothetical protein
MRGIVILLAAGLMASWGAQAQVGSEPRSYVLGEPAWACRSTQPIQAYRGLLEQGERRPVDEFLEPWRRAGTCSILAKGTKVNIVEHSRSSGVLLIRLEGANDLIWSFAPWIIRP